MTKRKSTTARVRRSFDSSALIDICERSSDGFDTYGKRTDLEGTDRFYYYADNGADILAIAHLDSVQSHRACNVTRTAAGLLATSGALDDRLGAYVILDLLPSLGITVDVLLTTDEEIGASTASDFDTDKQYDWMFQFDRGGTDVVMYEYETPELTDLVEDSGARVGVGSYSDICLLSHLGCSGFNWGVGYQDYHSPRSHAWLEDTFRMVSSFVRFHEANEGIFLPYDPSYYYEADDDDELSAAYRHYFPR